MQELLKQTDSQSGVSVLSLFDGMSCGMLAMMRAGVEVENYYAYEIDKYAIETSQYNFPQIKQCGDVFEGNFKQYEGVDYLIGGSPCTYWSIAQSADKRETTASGIGLELFRQYLRALEEAKPKYFLYENNKSMAKPIYDCISGDFGFEPICINSALLSAQNRQRLYWVGRRNADGTYSKVHIEQPEDRGILLRDILESGSDLTNRNKSFTLTATYDRAVPCNTIERSQRPMVIEPIGVAQRGRGAIKDTEQHFEARQDSKSNALTTVSKDSMVAEPIGLTKDGKAQCLRATIYKDGIRNIVANEVDRRTGVAEPVCMRYERSDEAKAVRKEYESGEVKHGFHELSELHPRPDGKTNTLSTVLKDNPICEPVVEPKHLGLFPTEEGEVKNSQGYRAYSIDGKSVSQKAQNWGIGAQTGLYVFPLDTGETEQDESFVAENYGECTADSVSDIENEEAMDNLSVASGTVNTEEKRGIERLTDNIPEMSNEYNAQEITDKLPILTTGSMETGRSATNKFENIYGYAVPTEYKEGIPIKAKSSADGKVYPVYVVSDGQIVIKQRHYPIKLKDGYYIIRKLTVTECKRLQTVPDWYEFPVSSVQAYKMLGNGWTVDVIAHLLISTKKEEFVEAIDIDQFI